MSIFSSALSDLRMRSNEKNALGVSRLDKEYASKTRARIARSEWQDYLRAYGPLEDELLRTVNNPLVRDQAVSGARSLVRETANASDAAYRERLASYGLTMTPVQEASYARNRNIDAGLADVEAANRTTRNIKDRDRTLIAGGLSAGLNSLNQLGAK